MDEIKKKLEGVLAKFLKDERVVSYHQYTSGHINDTFQIQTMQGSLYVLQKMNGVVFQNAKDVINNKIILAMTCLVCLILYAVYSVVLIAWTMTSA